MWHIFIVVMLGGQTWQWEWSNSYPSVEDCDRAFVEEVWPELKPKGGANVRLICSQKPPILASEDQ